MLVVGLGNPGSSYEKTRHNIGFMVIDELLRRTPDASKIQKASFEGELYKIRTDYFLKPHTFMNLSGRSILAVKQFYKIDEVIVIHDDLDLPFGALRFKQGGGHGGHNGLRSTDDAISKAYVRVRMGIGKPPHKEMVKDYVLEPFSGEEAACLPEWIAYTADAVEQLLKQPWQDVSSVYALRGDIKQFPLQSHNLR
jgi:PTH1 family peptidyl-tRNA hydrolase